MDARFFAFGFAVPLALALAAGEVRASGTERWTAISNTAESITGDVTFAPGRITFSNRARIVIAFVRTLRRSTWLGTSTSASPILFYRIAGKPDPVLLRGNRFCGRPAAYATVVRKRGPSPGSVDVELAIFTSDPTRDRTADRRLCATYAYSAMVPVSSRTDGRSR